MSKVLFLALLLVSMTLSAQDGVFLFNSYGEAIA